jgi:RES domain
VTLPQRFPLATLRGDREIYRIHRSARDPWWFSTDGSGRFDPIGTGSGSCYFSRESLGAWIEVFRKQILLAGDEVSERSLYAVRLGRDLKLADITSRRALQFGITASLGANEDYAASQTFAADALASGFDGIRYLVRHDPAQKLYGYALFGQPGSGAATFAPSASAKDGSIPDALVDDARRMFGYRVLPTP